MTDGGLVVYCPASQEIAREPSRIEQYLRKGDRCERVHEVISFLSE